MSWLSDKTIEHLRNLTEYPDLSHTPYTCLEKVATGGMAAVFLVEDSRLHRKIAMKILDLSDPDGELAERMMQEARIIAALEHPSIIPIHDVGSLPDGRIFYTMKFIKGARMDERVKESTSLPELLRIFQKICEGVAYAHAHDVIHRDLKPENIMVGDFGEVLVMDWGLAKVLFAESKNKTLISKTRQKKKAAAPLPSLENAGQPVTEHGTVMGTPTYMAPEQASGAIDQIDQRTDIYALGAILNFILTGAESNQTVPEKQHAFFARFRKNAPPKQLLAIANKAMSPNKRERYSDALELIAEIENYLNGFPVSAYKENVLEIALRWLKQNKFIIVLIVVYIFVRILMFFISRL